MIQKMKLHNVKVTDLARHAIGKLYEEETIDLLKQSTACTIGFDESKVNKTNELEVLVKTTK